MSGYQYEPLSAPDSIRLLLLQPSASQDILRGSLLNTTLSECDYDLIDNYTALSYVWGSGEKPCQIFLDGHAVGITRSLSNALRDLRDAKRVRRIWADALCIDQNNIPERNNQVMLMGHVYSYATHTVIYLGDLTADVSEVFAAAAPRQLHNAVDYRGKDLDTINNLGVQTVLSRPWFKRVWVFQELILSHDPWVQCGNARLRWPELCRLLLGNGDNRDHRSGGDGSGLQVLRDMDVARARKHDLSLVDALKARRGLGATDPRDFVYANLGVANDDGLQADYGKTTQEVYIQVAIYMLERLGIGELVSYTDDVAGGERLEGLPSWAPDWRLQSSGSTPLPPRETHEYDDRYLKVDNNSHHVFVRGDGSPVMGNIGYMVNTVKVTSGIIPAADAKSCVSPDYENAWDALNRRDIHRSRDPANTWNVLSHKWASWVQLFRDLEGPSTPESLANGGFAAVFDDWVSVSTEGQDNNTGVDWPSLFVELIHEHFRHSDAQSPLTNRRLAITDTGTFCVVPSQTKNGDVIGYLAGSAIEVVFRPVQTSRIHEIDDAIVQALRESGRGTLAEYQTVYSSFTTYKETRCIFSWSMPDNLVVIKHYSVIGEALREGYGGWNMITSRRWRKVGFSGDLQVIALH